MFHVSKTKLRGGDARHSVYLIGSQGSKLHEWYSESVPARRPRKAVPSAIASYGRLKLVSFKTPWGTTRQNIERGGVVLAGQREVGFKNQSQILTRKLRRGPS